MTNEQIKDIKLALKCCADEVDGCPKCPYARKNSKDGIAHCREMYLDALQLINEYEQKIAQLELELSRYRGGGDLRIKLNDEVRKTTATDICSYLLEKIGNIALADTELVKMLATQYGVEVKE